jgi:hypothetical protein
MDALMPEVGHVRVMTPAGQEFDFIPSLGAINSLGSGAEIIQTAADLFDRRPLVHLTAARCVLRACLVGQADLDALVGCVDGVDADQKPVDVPGSMPAVELLAVARHLVQHGMVGKARPGGGSRGEFASEFSVAEHVASAQAHLGVTKEQVLAMTMTELQLLIEAKFPEARGRKVPTREEYDRQMAAYLARREAKAND